MNSSIGSVFYLARNWLAQDPDPETSGELAALLKKATAGHHSSRAMLDQTFGTRLAFGTAGIRGPLGAGPAAMNRIVVSQTTAGLASFLLSHRSYTDKRLRVVVGYDARKNSAVFARDTAKVLSGYDIEALLTPHEVPTPVLAFAVRHLRCDAGVMITASHNPSEDNGYKVYFGGEDGGSQIIPPVDRGIETEITNVSQTLRFDEIPRSEALIVATPRDLLNEYIAHSIAAVDPGAPPSSAPKIVYTPMHGVGGDTFIKVLEAAGLQKPIVVDEQFAPDARFPTVEFPNPEEKGALDLAYARAREVSADLIIAHDPDADRLAVALADSSSPAGYTSLTGNQVGAILGWRAANLAHKTGQSGALANSLVSSPALGKIAEHFGLAHQETLTGFKYVSRVPDLLFGFEEALGYLVNPGTVRDKDGISAGLAIVDLTNNLGREGKIVRDYLNSIEQEIGAFASSQITVKLESGTPASRLTNLLRSSSISVIGARAVTQSDDFLDGVSGFPSEDILRYYLDDGTRVIVRPSGTEPKVKVYIDTEGATSAEAQSRLTEVESDINEVISSL